MSNFNKGKSLRELMKGLKVERVTATLPQTAAAAIFTIATGRVLLMEIIGEVTIIMGATANNTKLTANPTIGTAGDICAVLATENDEAGTLYTITGLITDALVGVSAGGSAGMTRPVILPVGTLDLDCAANNTGSVKWTAFYIPVDDGATLVAA